MKGKLIVQMAGWEEKEVGFMSIKSKSPKFGKN